MKKKITKEEYLQLEGLKQLAQLHEREGENLSKAIAMIVGEELDENNYGISTDFIWEEITVGTFLKRHEIKVKK